MSVDESNKLVTIVVSVIMAVLVVSITMSVVYMGQQKQNDILAELGEMNVQYDVTSLDGQRISGSAIHALIVRGVPVKATSYGPNLTREEARIAYISTRWYEVSIITGNEDTVLIS